LEIKSQIEYNTPTINSYNIILFMKAASNFTLPNLKNIIRDIIETRKTSIPKKGKIEKTANEIYFLLSTLFKNKTAKRISGIIIENLVSIEKVYMKIGDIKRTNIKRNDNL
jgi:hypothetical protein